MAKRAKTLDDAPDERDPLLIEVGARIFEGRRSLKLSQTQLGLLGGRWAANSFSGGEWFTEYHPENPFPPRLGSWRGPERPFAK